MKSRALGHSLKDRKAYPLGLGFVFLVYFVATPLYAQEPARLIVITPKRCSVCNTQAIVDYFKKEIPGLTVSYLYYPNLQANKTVKYFGIKALPAYLLGKEAEKEGGFGRLKGRLEAKGDFYILKPEFSGLSYFIQRKRIAGKLDLFISLYDKNTAELLDAIREFKPSIHFLAISQQDKFDARRGNLEVEEYLRAVCVQKYHPENFWDYINCRAKNINSCWWEDCLVNLDTDKIKICAKGSEGSLLLKENIALNKELQIMAGPTYLLDNVEIFASQGVPAKEEFKKITNR